MRSLETYREVTYLAGEILGTGFAAGLEAMSPRKRVEFLKTLAFATRPERPHGEPADFFERQDQYYALLFAAMGDIAVETLRYDGHPEGVGNVRDAWRLAIPARIHGAKRIVERSRNVNQPALEEIVLGWAQLDSDDDAADTFRWLLEQVDAGKTMEIHETLRTVPSGVGNLNRLLDALSSTLNHEGVDAAVSHRSWEVDSRRQDIANVLRHALVNSTEKGRLASLHTLTEPLLRAESDMVPLIRDEAVRLANADATMQAALKRARQIVATLLPDTDDKRRWWWVSSWGNLTYDGRVAVLEFDVPEGVYAGMSHDFWLGIAAAIQAHVRTVTTPTVLKSVELRVISTPEEGEPIELLTSEKV